MTMKRCVVVGAAAVFACGAGAGVTDTLNTEIDLGPIGDLGGYFQSPGISVGNLTPGEVNIDFSDGKGLLVEGSNIFGLDFFMWGGTPDFGGNWTPDIAVHFLDSGGGTIATELYDNQTVATFAGSTAKRGLDTPLEFYGMRIELSDPAPGPLPQDATIGFFLGGSVSVVPSPGASALLGLGVLAAARRRR